MACTLKHDATSQPAGRWNGGIIALHWATVICVVALVDTGWQVRALMGDLGPRTEVLRLHASLGVLLLAVTTVRVLARLVARQPPATATGRLRPICAGVVQVALYVSLLALIATGILAATPRPFMPTVQLFGLWPLPRVVGIPREIMRSAPGLHAALVWVLVVLISAHVAAAIYGTFVAGDGTIFRMLPRRQRRDQT